MATDLHTLTVREARDLLQQRQISSVELTQASLARIESVDPIVRTYLTVRADIALEQAAEADARLRANDRVTPLTGIPFAVKDCLSGDTIRIA